MSDTGLYSTFYSQMRDLSETLDAALIEIKSTNSSEDRTVARRLGEQLFGIADLRPKSIADSILRSALIKAGKKPAEISALGAALLGSEKPNLSIVKELEMLAVLLDGERSGLAAKMRGTL